MSKIYKQDNMTIHNADHHKGYDQANWINVQFICVKCDGEQLRKDYD